MINRNMKVIASSVVAAVLSSSTVFAAGFEKSIPWSGKYAGQGNAAVSSATGAEALYFNPAGLAGSKGTEVSLNVSPTSSQFNSPVLTDNTPIESKSQLSPSFGAMATYSINEKLAVGVGAYVAAAAKAEYDAQTLVGTTIAPKTDLTGLEYSVAVGYEVMSGLKVGAAWRMATINAAVTYASGSEGSTAVATLTDLKATRYNGYRLGIQYQPSDTWGLGISYRGKMAFSAEGSLTAKALNDSTVASGASASVSTELPEQVSIGGHSKMGDNWFGALEYVWTHYGRIGAIDVTGTAGALGALTDINTNWSNQTNIRAGMAYTGLSDWTLRGGYVYTSQVTPANRASPTFTPPGVAHSFTAGFSKPMSGSMDLNAAAEYSTASGAGSAPAKTGDYKASAMALHTGVSYRF